MEFPDAPRLPLVDVLHGRDVPDPYKWLEEEGSPETMSWCAAQDGLFQSYVEALDRLPHFSARLADLSPGFLTGPVVAGGRAFFLRRRRGEAMSLVVVDPAGAERSLIDRGAMSRLGAASIELWRPSTDGRRIAYSLRDHRTEESVLFIAEVDDGRVIDGPIDRVNHGSLAWLPDGDEFFYVRRPGADAVPQGESRFHRRVYRHHVGEHADGDHLVFGEGRPKTDLYELEVSRSGRWLLVHAGSRNQNELYLWDLVTDRGPVAVLEGGRALSRGRFADEHSLYLLTSSDAPCGRVVVVEPTAPSSGREMIAESDEPITGMAVGDGVVVVVRDRDVASRVTVHERTTGAMVDEIRLPGLGVAEVTGSVDGGGDVWIRYSDYTTPIEVWRYSVEERRLHTWARAGERPAVDAVTEQFFGQSRDGTRIPLFVVRPTGGGPGGPRPCILAGYGGFGIKQLPMYSAFVTAWVEAGGVYAWANVRGGSEYGERWHRAGMREHKQNSFDDFIAAAEWLVSEGWTDRRRLGIAGASEGGLLVGAVLTQRPDLFAAASAAAPVLDLIGISRAESFPFAAHEHGTPDRAEELEWLLGYSPYHHVVPGTEYPAVMLTLFGSDVRIPASQATKMCAALQWATTAQRPVVLRRIPGQGHASGLDSVTLAFFARELGPPPP